MEHSSKQLCYKLLDVLFAIKHDLSSYAEEQGLTQMQLYGLMEIDRNSPVSMSKVAIQLQCDASNVTGIIDRLVKRGLIDRVENEQDRREKMLRLTTAGQLLVDQFLTILPMRLTNGKLDEQEILSLTVALEKLTLHS